MAGGAHFVHMDRQFTATTTGGNDRIDADIQFDGVGPTLFLEGSRPLLGGLRFIANGRGSLLYGSESWTMNEDESSRNNIVWGPGNDSLLSIIESQVGVSWEWCFAGKVLEVRAAMEGQYWIGGGGWVFDTDDGGAELPTNGNFVLSTELAFFYTPRNQDCQGGPACRAADRHFAR